MSEISAEYETGMEKLELWKSGRICVGSSMYVLGLCEVPERHGPHEIEVPDIRAPGNEALAWRALEQLVNLRHVTLSRRIYDGPYFVASNMDIPGQSGERLVDALYGAVEEYGRTP